MAQFVARQHDDDEALRPEQRQALEWLGLQFHRQAKQLERRLLQGKKELCQAQFALRQQLIEHHRSVQTPHGDRRRQLQVLEKKHQADRERFELSRKAKQGALVENLNHRYETFRERLRSNCVQHGELEQAEEAGSRADGSTLADLSIADENLKSMNRRQEHDKSLEALRERLQVQREELVLAQEQELARLRCEQLEQQEQLAQRHQQQWELLQQQHEAASRPSEEALLAAADQS